MKTTATVQRWISEKGYGFAEDRASSYFVHIRDVEGQRPLEPGMEIEGEVQDGPKGLRLERVRIVR